VRTALASHEQANFSSSGLLIDMMGRDDRLGSVTTGVIGTRANGLLGSKFSMRPADEDNPAAVRAAEEIEAVWWDILPESTLKVLLRYFWLGGGAPAELRWRKLNGRWAPLVRPWQLKDLYMTEMSDDEQLAEYWWLQTRSGQVEFTPGDGKWMLIADGNQWWLNGSVRALSVPWLIKQFALRDWARHSERLGMPIIKAMYPSNWDAPEVDEWYSELANSLTTELTAKLPQGNDDEGSFDLQLLEAEGRNWESFPGLIGHVDTVYAVHMLGHNLTTEVKGGSFAAANTGNDVRIDYKRSDAETLSTQLRMQVNAPICQEWYGDPSLAPWPHWEVEPPEDKTEKAEAVKLAGEAIVSLQKAGYQLQDPEEFGAAIGVAIEPIPEDEKKPPTAAQHPAGTEDPEDDIPPTERAPDPIGDDDDGDELPEEPEQKELHLASGDPISDAPGFVGGQQFADDLVDAALPLGQKAMAPDIKAILAVVDDAIAGRHSPEELKDTLVRAYDDMDPSELAALLEKSFILAELKGISGVLEDL
jgi:phage gp29-like protein